MPVTKTFRTPGVYVTEEDAFPPSIVGVQTALPAFIGYTEKAELAGKPIFGKPQKISSFAEYVAIFGEGFQPVVNIVDGDDSLDGYDVTFLDKEGDPQYYKMEQEDKTKFNLYASMKLFFDNGGDQCFVVAVGDYSDTIELASLQDGLKAIGEITGPTMLVVPDAVLLPTSGNPAYESTDFYTLMKDMLKQCADLQDRVAIIDVYGADALNQEDPANFSTQLGDTINYFRSNIGTDYLSYGATYFPFLKTSVMSASDVTYLFFDPDQLNVVLKHEAAAIYADDADQREQVDQMIDDTKTVTDNTDGAVDDLNGNLTNALPVLKEMETQLRVSLGTLPPSAAMAGVISRVDNDKGVWNAPANVSLNSVIAPTVAINNDQQADLNVPLDGKAIDVIRSFPGRGTVPWGARTLLGNSNDWRYLQIRRTMIYIEQSIKTAMMPFVFAANNGKTWSTVVASISNFLQQTWSQGGLMGNTPDKAFSVECGLGSTMTAQDIMEGYMVVEVRVAMVRPAEFIVLNFKQKMLEA